MKILLYAATPPQVEDLLAPHSLTTCSDRAMAAQASEQAFYPLIIIEGELPEGVIVEFCRHVRSLPDGAWTSLLVLAANPIVDRVQKFLDTEADMFFSAHCSPEEFTKAWPRIERDVQRLERLKRREEEKRISLQRANQHIQEELLQQERRITELRDSETYYRKLFEENPVGYQSLDKHGCFLEVNPAWLRQLGYTRQEVIGKWFGDFLAPAWVPLFEKNFPLFQDRRKVCDAEYNMLRKDGSTVYMSFVGKIGYDEQGQPTQTHCILTNITEQKSAEKALQEDYAMLEARVVERTVRLREANKALKASEERLGLLIDTQQEGLGIVDEHETFTFSNPAADRIFGVFPGSLVGRNLVEFMSADTTALMRRKTKDRIEGKIETYHTTIFSQESGQKMILQVTAAPTYDGNGKFIGTFGAFKDVTDLKQAEERLKYRERFENLLMTLSTKFVNLSSEQVDQGIQNVLKLVGEFSLVDRSYVFLFDENLTTMDNTHEWCAPGISSQKENLQQIATSDFPWWMATLKRLEPLHIPSVARLPQEARQEKPVLQAQEIQSLVVLPIHHHKTLRGFVGFDTVRTEKFWNDETIQMLKVVSELFANALERKQKEEEIYKAKEDAVSASRAKSEFLANMSHELRTPLNTVLGLAEALQMKVYGELPPKQRQTVATIEESGTHLLELINDILDLSKVEAERLDLDLTRAPVEAVCQASLRFIKQNAHKKHLKMILTLDSQVETVLADERRLKQILVNLLTNAVKFTPEGGQIGLETEGLIEQQQVNFIVWDSGIGISQDQIKDVFSPFVQLDRGFARRYEGSGLGLTLVQRMTEMHGGTVTVESQIGKGSRFIVTLPWQPEVGASPHSIHPMADRANPLSGHSLMTIPRQKVPDTPPLVLLAEDQESNIRTLSDFLQAKGFRVLIARNGLEAVELTQQEHPDIVLMDIYMPELDGLEAIRRIRAREDTRRIPIIAVTALAMRGDEDACLAAGADSYLSKPVSLKALLTLLHQFLGIEDIDLPSETAEPSYKGQGFSQDEIQDLLVYTKRGNLKKIQEALSQLQQIAPEKFPLIEKMRRYAEEFQFEKIVTLLSYAEDDEEKLS